MDHPNGRTDRPPLRLMTWNLRSLRDDRVAVIKAVRRLEPDVLFVQETPRFFRARSKLAALARESGLVVASGGYPAAEVAILTDMRVTVRRSEQSQLSRTPGRHRRGVVFASLALGEREFSSVSLHLGLDGAERRRHVAEARDLLMKEAVVDTVIAGDFNETPAGPAWQVLSSGLNDVGSEMSLPTFPAKAPDKRIDAIFVPRNWSARLVSPTEIVDLDTLVRATDHLPAILDVVD